MCLGDCFSYSLYRTSLHGVGVEVAVGVAVDVLVAVLVEVLVKVEVDVEVGVLVGVGDGATQDGQYEDLSKALDPDSRNRLR